MADTKSLRPLLKERGMTRRESLQYRAAKQKVARQFAEVDRLEDAYTSYITYTRPPLKKHDSARIRKRPIKRVVPNGNRR